MRPKSGGLPGRFRSRRTGAWAIPVEHELMQQVREVGMGEHVLLFLLEYARAEDVGV